MDESTLEKLKQYNRKYNGNVKKLGKWLAVKDKPFKMVDTLECIYNAAGGRETVMNKIIDQLTATAAVRGRSQVYADSAPSGADIIRNEEGNLELKGFVDNEPVQKPPTKAERNSNIFKKSDGQTKKIYQKTEEKFKDVGQFVRTLFPNADKGFIETAIKSIVDLAAARRKTPEKIMQRIKNGRLVIDSNTGEIKPTVKESRTVIISEDTMKQIKQKYAMTDHVFLSNVKDFLSQLLNDPVNAKPSEMLLAHHLDRNTLLKYLKDYGVIVKREKLSNKDSDGNPKELTMKVKYGIKGTDRGERDKNDEFDVPKKNFENKILNMFIDLFESNLPQDLNEDGEGGSFISGGGDGAGQFVTKLGTKDTSMITQKSLYEEDDINETTTTFSVGAYVYDRPAFLDDETADRGEKNGSISVEIKK